MDRIRFNFLATSNSTLSPTEVLYLRGELEVRKEKLARLQQELEVPQSECYTYESLLSPLRRNVLPQEVLAVIFFFTLPDPGDGPRLLIDQQVQYLCLVCQAWREAALAAPALWSRVEIKVAPSSPFTRIYNWFRRAGALSKYLTLIDLDDHSL
ncbi:hypothetical protein NMY22_g13136 [Coprinellus aureogranulatus]|nr:hypothetical protein NMY22_g13136 [Coprinellus aureogranulatus]